MKLYNPDGTELMTITSLERLDNKLVVRGKIFGTMPINAQLRPAQAKAGLKLLSLRKVLFIISLLFRK